MSVLFAGQNSRQLSRIMRLVASVTDAEQVVAREIPDVRRKLDECRIDTLIFDFDSFCSEQNGVMDLLMALPEDSRLRQLIFVSRGKLPLFPTPLIRMLLACHCDPRNSDQELREMLSRSLNEGSPCASALQEFRGLSQFQLTRDGMQVWSYMPEMQTMLQQLSSVAEHEATILIVAETGSGKSHVARIVHQISPRRSAPYHSVACGAISRNLIESELFGHVRGAFTGADRSKVGRFEAVGHGTILLDEIDTLSPVDQSKLLHIVETGEYQAVGSAETKTAQARIIAASNRDLRSLVSENRFRADLFYRLNTLEFRIPPLRERPHDILPLAAQFVQDLAQEYGVSIESVEAPFLQRLLEYSWPGNVRELLNQMRRVILLSQNGVLKADLLSTDIQTSTADSPADSDASADNSSWNLYEHIGLPEKELVCSALAAHGNNRSATARALGISRFGLYKKLERLGLHSRQPVNG